MKSERFECQFDRVCKQRIPGPILLSIHDVRQFKRRIPEHPGTVHVLLGQVSGARRRKDGRLAHS
ncbi:MAG: hypothetical protein JSR91_06475 [Proteobacteria bacterium]|nr:hypothetical protein [Pseudomonadota bacterium]